MGYVQPIIVPIKDATNASIIDLASHILTQNLPRVSRITAAHKARMIGSNTGLISTKFAPVNGVKQSGLGREGLRHGLEEHLETKYVRIGGV